MYNCTSDRCLSSYSCHLTLPSMFNIPSSSCRTKSCVPTPCEPSCIEKLLLWLVQFFGPNTSESIAYQQRSRSRARSMGRACTWHEGPAKLCQLCSISPNACRSSLARAVNSASTTHLVPLSHAIMFLVQSLPLGHVVGAVEAREVDPVQRTKSAIETPPAPRSPP